MLLTGFAFLLNNACGELSTNLQIRTVRNSYNNRVESQTYIDSYENAVIADDKGYATVQYTYGTV